MKCENTAWYDERFEEIRFRGRADLRFVIVRVGCDAIADLFDTTADREVVEALFRQHRATFEAIAGHWYSSKPESELQITSVILYALWRRFSKYRLK